MDTAFQAWERLDLRRKELEKQKAQADTDRVKTINEELKALGLELDSIWKAFEARL